MLYPQQNIHRAKFNLDGFWNFKPDPEQVGHIEKWYLEVLEGETHKIAIPGSWNEQLAEQGFKNYIGRAWHETFFTLPEKLIQDQRIWIRIGAADHKAEVWINGKNVGSHEGGYLPFSFEITEALGHNDEINRLVICVDSTLDMHTLPQDVDPKSYPYNTKSYQRRHLFPPTRFDFFPYGGLTRPVDIFTTPKNFISDIKIDSGLDGSVSLKIDSTDESLVYRVVLKDMEEKVVASNTFENASGSVLNLKLASKDVHPWSPSNPHLYTLKVELIKDDSCIDVYYEDFGIREITINNGTIYLNGRKLFMNGFGKHEDFPIVGRGQFRPGYIRDFELMRWIGSNSFRTSHYPYDDEIIRLADKLGFLVINEVPAVSLGFWSDKFDDLKPLLDNHKRSISELIDRDYNRPSVISWSVTNEPNLWAEEHYQNEASKKYFKELYNHTKDIDSSRPIMSISMSVYKEDDVALEFCDLIGINRYYGWYTEPVNLDKAASDLAEELDAIFNKHQKPVMVTEFGADTVEGMHSTTPQMFTEEYQVAFIFKYLEVLEQRDFIAGAHIWNFADFLTPQHYRRMVLNKKGVFTRNREPKTIAFKLREHWRSSEKKDESHMPYPPKDGYLISNQ